MNKKAVPNASLDLQFLTHKKSRVVSSQEALKDIEPIKWDSEILKGKKKSNSFG